MPHGNAKGQMHGFQLWANLPKKHKMTGPRYRDIRAGDIPEYKGEGFKIKLICGDYGDVKGPARDILTEPWFFDVQADPGAEFTLKVRPEDNVLCCVFEGKGRFDKEKKQEAGPGQLAVLEEGGAVACSAGPEGLRFMLMAGKPLKEPVAWSGPAEGPPDGSRRGPHGTGWGAPCAQLAAFAAFAVRR